MTTEKIVYFEDFRIIKPTFRIAKLKTQSISQIYEVILPFKIYFRNNKQIIEDGKYTKYILKVFTREPQLQWRLGMITSYLYERISRFFRNKYPHWIKISILMALPLDFGTVYFFSAKRKYPAVLFKSISGEPLLDKDTFQLSSLLKRMSIYERKELATYLISGVYFLHSINIVHADLAPTNMIINKFIRNGNKYIRLTVLDIDGGGILKTNGTWYIRPLVGGTSLPGMPLSYEASNQGKIYKGTDIWWLAMCLFLIFTNKYPFFFLTTNDRASLDELYILMKSKDNDKKWPPEYDIVENHSKFRTELDWVTYNKFRLYLEQFIDTSLFYDTFITGYYNFWRRPTARMFWSSLIKKRGI